MKNYFRQFIVLSADRPSAGKQATGRVVLEAKDDHGKATVYLQNLAQGRYKLLLFAKGEGENFATDAGVVAVCDKGRFEGKFEFKRRDIAGCGLAVDNIEGAAIIQASENFNGQGDISVALAGFRDAPYSWRINLRFPGFDPKTEKVEAANQEPLHIPEPESAPMPAPEPVLPAIPEEVPSPVYSGSIADFQHTHNPVQPEKPVPQPNRHLDSFFEASRPVDLFRDHKPYIKWVAANLKDMQALEMGDEEIRNSPFVQEKSHRYRHILMGRDENGNYALAVPDVFCKHVSREEFDAFKLCQPGTPVDGSPGYWVKYFG
ncbi:MAG: hypothetical protein FWB98_05045 [Defluviitaleaceae bacterium]|nr:hypothetical protein [Defluviitaleaceae bacterium]